MIVLQELSLELGHIDARRALGFARLARHTEIHNLLDFLAIEGISRVARVGEHLAQDVSACAGGVFFLAGGHVARAHRATGLWALAAITGAVALLGSAEHAHGVTEIEDGFILRGRLPRAVAQGGIHRWAVDDFPRVENIFRIEYRLHLAHQLITMIANHQRDELTAQSAITVFTTERATVFFHQVGDVGSDITKHFLPLWRLQIE